MNIHRQLKQYFPETRNKQKRIRFLSLLLSLQLAVSLTAYGGPTGGIVVGGEGSIDYQGANTTINQSTNRLAIDWQAFNVAEDESVQFIQPGRDAIALNRILDQNPSQIFGRIDANGNVILLNARGVFFGRSASVNVGGLVASALDVNPTEFINNESFTFSAVPGTEGMVVNRGLIEAAIGGSVSLLGKSVRNEGVILAKLGKVNLAAGSEAVLTFDADGLIGVSVTKEVMENDIGVDVAALNEGVIEAEGGQVIMSAKVSKDLFSSAVNNTGIVRANSVQEKNGSIYLTAQGGDVANSGTLNVSAEQQGVAGGHVIVEGDNIQQSGIMAADAAQGDGGSVELNSQDMTLLTGDSVTTARSETEGSGGTVMVLGDKVGLFDSSQIDVSGANGGGTVLIGGDVQGNNPLVKNAASTFVGGNSKIDASAVNDGDGGKVVVYANDSAKIYGDITATGGQTGGDGGFVETSGKNYLDISMFPDLTAANGLAGSWLIDPRNVFLVAGSGSSNISDTNPFIPDGNGAQLGIDLILSALGNGTSVEVNTGSTGGQAGNITLEVDFDYDGIGTGATLTLWAANHINLDNRIFDGNTNTTDNLNLVLDAGNTTSTGDVDLTNYAGTLTQIETNGGNFEAYGDDFQANANSAIDTGTGNFTISMIGDVELPKITTQGDLSVTTTGASVNNSDAISQLNNASLSIQVGGAATFNAGPENINLSNTGNDFSSVEIIGANVVTLNDANSIILNNINTNGNVTVNAEQDISVSGAVTGSGLNLNLRSGITGADSTVTLYLDDINRNVDVRGGTSANNTLEVLVSDTGVIPSIDWTITQDNLGSFDDGSASTRSFSLIENLTGGAQDDNFVFGANGAIDGTLNGGTSSNDSADYSAVTNPVTVDLNDVIGIETLTGNNGLLIGADFVNNWSFSGTTQVTNINDNVTTVFTGFDNITGGSDQDIFAMDDDFAGAISGGGGGDTFNLNVSNTGSIDGGAGSDTFVVADGVTLASVNGGTSVDDNDHLNLSAYAIDTNWIMDPSGNNQITDTNATPIILVNFTGMESFTAGSMSNGDSFNYGSFTTDVSVNLASAINFESIVGGQGANDTLIGDNNNNDWRITEENGGCVANAITLNDCVSVPVITFSGFENLTGGTGNDDFIFNNNSNITGILNGGDGTDTADYSNYSVDLMLRLANIQNIETLTGGAGTNDTLVGADIVDPNRWTLTGSTSGAVNGMSFSSIENVTGGINQDIFTYNDGVVFNGIVDGGDGDNDMVDYSNYQTRVDINLQNLVRIEEVIGSNSGDDHVFAGDNENFWTITDLNQGNVLVAGTTLFSFSGIENIDGGTSNDTFLFDNDSAEITGSIDGGLGTGTNILDYSGISTNVDVTVDRETPSNSTAIGGFSNIQEFVGGSGSNDTIKGMSGGETWDITGPDSGTVAGTTFSSFEKITGGSGDDTFQIRDSGSVSGTLDGGDGDGDRLDYRLITANGSAVTVNLDSLTRIEQVFGTDFSVVGQNDTFRGSVNTTNNWEISSENGGTVNNAVAFFGFENLAGGNQDDYFDFGINGSVTGTVDGDSTQGINRLNYASVSSDITVDLGQNTATLTGGITNINDVTGGSGNNDTLVGGNAAENNWNITGSNSGDIDNSFVFRSIENLTGGDLDDTFNMEEGGVIGGTLDGGAGSNNTLDYQQRTTQVAVDLNGPSATDVNAFTNIQTIIGGQSDDTFQAADGSTNNWTITGSDSGSVAGIAFQSFESLLGGDGSDEFAFDDGVSFGGTIDGGTGATNTLDYSNYVTTGVTINLASLINFSDIVGSALEDTIVGHNDINTWTVSDTDQGSLSNNFGTFTFSAIENLIGGNSSDNFFIQSNVAATGSIGTINGGQGVNSLNYSNYANSAVTVDLSQNTATGVNQFTSISSVTGSAQSDTLIADNATDNVWDINQTNGGTLNNQFGFSGIENLTGSTSDDTFVIGSGATVGNINGGGGSGVDTLEYSATSSSIIVDLANGTATNTGGISNIENLIGSPIGSTTLIGPNGINNWDITGLNTGNIYSFTFSNVNAITGGSARDVFNVSAAGNIPLINGGAGNDELNIVYSSVSRDITFDGGQDADTVNFAGSAPLGNTVVVMSDTGPNNLETTSGNQSVDLENIEQFNDSIVGSAISIYGPDSNNDIQIDTGTLNGSNPTSVVFNGFVPIEFSGKEIAVIRGGQGTDAITVNSDFTVPSRLILSAESLNAGTFTLASNVLVLSGINSIGTASQYLLTDVSQLQLIGTGDSYILETNNGVDLLPSDVNGNLYLAALIGDITSTRRLSVTGNASFTAASGAAISLTDPNNSFMGELEFTTFNPLAGVLSNVQLVNNTGVLLANVDTTDLSIIASGDISDVDLTGEVTASGITNLDASGNNVTLDNASHDFGVVNANNVAQFVLSDQNNVGIGAIVADEVSINAGGAVLNSNTGATNVVANDLAITAAGGIGDNLSLSTDVTSVSLSNTQSGNINLNNQGSLIIASIDNSATAANSGSVNMTSSGTITQTGNVVAANNVGLNASNDYLQRANIDAENNVNVNANSGEITMQDGSRTDSNGATINYSADGTVTVSTLDAVYAQGSVEITSDTGSIISSRAPDLSRPNVTGNFALFNAEFGSLGEPGRPLVINVPGRVLINTFTSVAPIYLVPPSEVIDTSRLLFNINETKSVLGDSQRTEVDELAVIDPAVFTQVKNYAEDQYPVKLPRDQLYTEDEEEKDKKADDPDLFEVEETGQNTGL